jgi:hypothetical protein
MDNAGNGVGGLVVTAELRRLWPIVDLKAELRRRGAQPVWLLNATQRQLYESILYH